ncbi:MAG: glucose-phosphate thymidylyltransferase [Thermotogaceae bacterium]|jgi:glucose-1-phosphate thymidylyltransferase|nr:glucose-phosphate thymidylyltransferase [Thermotogaceae bacterium]MDN5337066.1 glucose-phosphate thymidylyltransferase [Thermotogaceae bacterium]
MKALILCAGKGTRLRPLTFTNAKQLIPVANKPVILYSIENIKNSGIKDIGIVVNSENREAFQEKLGDGSDYGIKITYILQQEPKGLAHAVRISKDYIKDEPFMLYLGDNLIFEDIKEYSEKFLKDDCSASILLTPVPNPSQFGIAVLDDHGNIMKVVEKPKDPPSNFAIIGVYFFRKEIFEAIENIKPSWRGEYEITDAIEYLVENGKKVRAHVIYGWWKDMGRPEDLSEANRRLLEKLSRRKILGNVDDIKNVYGVVEIGENSEIVNSQIRGPVIIGKNTVIKDSYIGPYTSIGNNVFIQSSEIENSIVMDNTTIINIDRRIDNSIIGSNAKLVKTDTRPRVLRFVIGDYSSFYHSE